MRLADLLTDRDHDTLPADHRAKPERDGDRDLDPERNVFGRIVELALVGDKALPGLHVEGRDTRIHHDADGLRDEIHVLAHVVDGGGRDPAKRTVFVDLSIDLAHELRHGGDAVGLQLLGADVLRDCGAAVSRRTARRKFLQRALRRGTKNIELLTRESGMARFKA